MSKIFIIAGSSGAGKTYLLNNINYISEKLMVVKKKTTRNIRQQERESINYDLQFGFSVKDVLKCDFHYTFRGEWYGFNKDDIDTILSNDMTPILTVRRTSVIIALHQSFPGKIKSILCQSCLSTDNLFKYLLDNGVPLTEAENRVLSKHEEECNDEYKINSLLFDYTIVNYYDSKFIEESKKIILTNLLDS